MILGVFGFGRDMGIHVLVICSFKDLFTFIFKKALHSNISCFALLVIYNASSKIKRFRGKKVSLQPSAPVPFKTPNDTKPMLR